MIDRATAERLLGRAREASAMAYAPYSEFPVGAAVLVPSGEVFDGANIENASYPLTCCAERVAVFRAVMAGHQEISAVAVFAPKATPCPPCGACRQVLNEWRPPGDDLAVVLETADGAEIVPLGDLLPRSFGPRNLDATGNGG